MGGIWLLFLRTRHDADNIADRQCKYLLKQSLMKAGYNEGGEGDVSSYLKYTMAVVRGTHPPTSNNCLLILTMVGEILKTLL